MHISLKDDKVPVFSKADGSSLLLTRVAAGEEMDLGRSVKGRDGDWVEVTLADGRRGYIAGDTRIYKIKTASLKQDEADMLERPSFDAARKMRLTRGQKFLLLDVLEAGRESWVRIRDMQGREGYIHGETSIAAEEEGRSAVAPPIRSESPPNKTPVPRKKAGAVDIRNGIVAILLGVVLTAGSYCLAPQLGGKYYITWGIVVLGVFWLGRGFIRTLAGK
jgi:SH3-like domain-containing protein